MSFFFFFLKCKWVVIMKLAFFVVVCNCISWISSDNKLSTINKQHHHSKLQKRIHVFCQVRISNSLNLHTNTILFLHIQRQGTSIKKKKKKISQSQRILSPTIPLQLPNFHLTRWYSCFFHMWCPYGKYFATFKTIYAHEELKQWHKVMTLERAVYESSSNNKDKMFAFPWREIVLHFQDRTTKMRVGIQPFLN